MPRSEARSSSGNGLDQNDGGGYDNPSEAYADISAQFATRASCIGRGFDSTGANCSGYGDACLDCTGIRDDDWNKRPAHTPATPQGFVQNNCGSGGGPCGREEHCEGYVGGETIFDLATRDLPAAGLDADSAWQLAENRTGGAAYYLINDDREEETVTVHTVGANASLAVGAATLNGFALYQFGDLGGGVDVSAYAANAGAELPLGPGTLRAELISTAPATTLTRFTCCSGTPTRSFLFDRHGTPLALRSPRA